MYDLVDRVPVRLVKENGETIELDATSIDIFVDRVQSNFAIPLLQARKMGVDLNQAMVGFEIQGVFTNEEGQEAKIKSTGYIDFDQSQTFVSGAGSRNPTGTVLGGGLTSWFNGLQDVIQSGGSTSDVPEGLTNMHDKYIDLPVAYWVENKNDITAPITNGLKLWLKSDSLFSTLEHGDKVSSWPDSSGNGNDAVQSDTSKQPKWYEGGPNGKPIIRFDGSNDVLQVPFTADTNSEQMTVFVVNDLNTDNGAYNTPLSSRSTSPHGGYNFYFDMRAGQKQIEFWYSNGTAFGSVRTSTNFAKAHRNYIMTGHIRDTTGNGESDQITLYVNGDQKDQDTGVSFSPVTATSQTNVGAGGISGTSAELNGDMLELLIYNRALDLSEIRKVEGYLAAKYNIALDPNHPYKDTHYSNSSVRIVFDNDRKPSSMEPYGYVNRNRLTDLRAISASFVVGVGTVIEVDGNPLTWFETGDTNFSVILEDSLNGASIAKVQVLSVTATQIITNALIPNFTDPLDVIIAKNTNLTHTSSNQSRPCFVIPVKHITDYQDPGHHADGSPIDPGAGNYTNAAEYLAYMVSKALTTDGELSDRAVDANGHYGMSAIFETSIGTTNNGLNARVNITQKHATEIGEVDGVINHNIATEHLPLLKSFTGGQRGKQVKSAGDKAQDLIGIIANSQNLEAPPNAHWINDTLYTGLVGVANRSVYYQGNMGDYIHGIQIPYDTLVTKGKASKDAEVAQRNFFITRGGVNPFDKLSVSNKTHASTFFRPSSEGHRMSGIQGVVSDFIVHRDAEMQAYDFSLKFIAANIII